MCFIGKSEDYVWGGGPFDPHLPFEDNVLTSDETRFRYNMALMENIPAVASWQSQPFGWMKQAYRFMAQSTAVWQQYKVSRSNA